MAATPKRAAALTEAALVGEAVERSHRPRRHGRAGPGLPAPLTDMRATAAYRTRGAANLLYRFWALERAPTALPAAVVNVRALGAGELRERLRRART